MRSLPKILLALLAFAAPAAASCADSDRACYPSDWRGCACADGKPGYQQCNTKGTAYGVCDCSGMIPGLTTTGGGTCGGAGGGGGEGGGGLCGFMESCETDEQCETGLCYPFNAKGPHCSMPCAIDSDCPSPSPGCNNMGICKAP